MTITGEIVSAIMSHHAELQASLSARVDAVLTAARNGDPYDDDVADLGLLLATDIVPHARAEEDVLYAAATDPTLRPLVTGMLFEHQTLLALAAELPSASTGVDAAGVARAIREVFVGHVRRENELLLPALADDPNTDLAALLPVMQERFATYRAAAAK
ncbi:MAG TPA: hemerythrin domain-containing protein [Mycobacteriales bacterium]|nr:hemerythrin domain-containing protein [Mycobacteriales bacterium]